MEAAFDHFDRLLSNSSEPLSFIIFIPEWRDPTPKVITKLEASKFKRKQLVISPFEHEFRHGYQHVCDKSQLNIPSPLGTLIVFLQNDAGFLKWGPTPERLDELLDAYRIGKDKEISLLSPPSTPQNNQKSDVEKQEKNNSDSAKNDLNTES